MRAGIVAGSVLLGVLISDWPTRWLRDLWAEYSMMTGLVSGFLLLLVTVVVVEEVLERRGALRWTAVANTAFRSLAGAPGDASEAMEVLVTGRRRPGRNRFDLPWDEDFQARLEAIRLEDVPLNEHETDNGFPAFFVAALRSRLDDPVWCDLAQRGTVAIRGAYRSQMTPWLPAMLATPDLAAVQNRIALFDLRLIRLQGPILELSRMGHSEGPHKGHGREHYTEVAYGLWQATTLEAVALSEGLYRASRRDSSDVHRDIPQRNRLDDEHLQALDRLDGELQDRLDEPIVGDTLGGDLGRGYTIVPPPATPRWRRVLAR